MTASLQSVSISSRADVDSRLLIEGQTGSLFSFGFLLPFILIAIAIAGSFIIPGAPVHFFKSGEFPSATINETLTHISPWMRRLTVSLQVMDLADPAPILRGNLTIAATSAHVPVFRLDSQIDRFLPANLTTHDMVLFVTDDLSFDTLNVTLSRFSCKAGRRWRLQWTTEGRASVVTVYITRFLFAALLIRHLVTSLLRTPRTAPLERWFTSAFTALTLLYLDPFYILQLRFPLPQRQL
jgi:hypothetical protein